MTRMATQLGNLLLETFSPTRPQANPSATTGSSTNTTKQDIAELLNQTALGITYRSILESIGQTPVSVSGGNVQMESTRELVTRFPELSSKLSEIRRSSSYLDGFREVIGVSNPIGDFFRSCVPLGQAVLAMREAGLLVVDQQAWVNSTYASPGSALTYTAFLNLTRAGIEALTNETPAFSNN